MRALLGAQQSSISLNEALEHSPDPLSDDLRCHRFCPRCPRQPPTMASFFPTADVANSRFDNDLSEDLIRGSPLWIRRVLIRALQRLSALPARRRRAQEGELRVPVRE